MPNSMMSITTRILAAAFFKDLLRFTRALQKAGVLSKDYRVRLWYIFFLNPYTLNWAINKWGMKFAFDAPGGRLYTLGTFLNGDKAGFFKVQEELFGQLIFPYFCPNQCLYEIYLDPVVKEAYKSYYLSNQKTK